MLQAGGWVMVELAISFAAISALVAAVISLLCLLRIGKAGRSESITKELMIQLFREEREGITKSASDEARATRKELTESLLSSFRTLIDFIGSQLRTAVRRQHS
jgi:hypothetical protein